MVANATAVFRFELAFAFSGASAPAVLLPTATALPGVSGGAAVAFRVVSCGACDCKGDVDDVAVVVEDVSLPSPPPLTALDARVVGLGGVGLLSWWVEDEVVGVVVVDDEEDDEEEVMASRSPVVVVVVLEVVVIATPSGQKASSMAAAVSVSTFNGSSGSLLFLQGHVGHVEQISFSSWRSQRALPSLPTTRTHGVVV